VKVVFDHSREEAANIRTFFFRPEKPVHYTSGQFAEWTLRHPDYDDRGVKRWFTISSSPIDELVSLTTKFNNERSSSFKAALFKLEPGDEVLMSDPMGDFVLPKLIQTPMVFVAGGIGITPFHSMLEWLAATNEERPIKFLYGVHTEDDIIFQDTFEKAGVAPSIVVSEPEDSWGGERGRLSSELVLGLGQPTEDTLIYLSGPEPMVEKLAIDLKRAGLKPRQVVVDAFPNYQSI
jgi:glycine betaine catabolism B